MKTDVLVLGAGMVGVSAALALQQRGRQVVLIDRRPAAEETSYGNAGLIQREGIVPYAFPRDFATILRSVFNQLPQSNLHWRAVPWLLPYIYQYWKHGTPERIMATAMAARPIVERSVTEHEILLEQAGVSSLVRRTGYIKVYRSEEKLAHEAEIDAIARQRYGVTSEMKTAAEIRALEPHLTGVIAGGVLMPQPVSVSDPGAVGKAYAELFVRRGGRFLTADAGTLQQVEDGWQVQRVEGPVTAKAAVVALGPWSAAVVRRVGVTIPMGVKRGYHMHYHPLGNAVLSRPVVDGESGYVMSAMTRGVRLTTGAEFALRDAPSTPVQLAKVEPIARALFPLGERVHEQPWLGARPCFPDMLPMIGEVPGRRGLWIDTGHHHLGFTLGPVTGRLLAEMLTGEPTFTDPAPYRVARFG